MFIINVTEEQIQYADELVNTTNFGHRDKGNGSKGEQRTGMIGQTVMADLLGLTRPTDGGGFDGGKDFIINNKKVDVKTMTRTTDVKDYYVHNFIGYQKDYDVDYYIFLSFNKNNDELTVCGCIDKKSFFEKADFYDEGTERSRSDGTSFLSKSPLYEIKQKELLQVENREEMLKLIK